MTISCISEYEKVLDNCDYLNSINRYFFSDSVDKFKILKQRDGEYPAIVTVSGFLSEDCDNIKNWQNSIDKAYPNTAWYHLEWNAYKNPFSREISQKAFFLQFPNNRFLNIVLSKSNLIGMAINNLWHVTVRNSRHSGKLLADTLTACNNKEFILIGHSLGARVIHNCLEHIGKKEIKTNVIEVHLLGGAVNSRVEKWAKTNNTVKNRVYNYYSNNDQVLKQLYSTFMIDQYPIGLKKIDIPYFVNRDTTEFISGHTEYIPNFHIIQINK